MSNETFAPFDSADYLNSFEDVTAYLEAVLDDADDDPSVIAAALGATRWLARGMVTPLQDMTRAASRMAGGQWSERIVVTSADGRTERQLTGNACDELVDAAAFEQEVADVHRLLTNPAPANATITA